MKLFKRLGSNKWWFKFDYGGKHYRHSTDIDDNGPRSEQEALTIANAYRTDVIRRKYDLAETDPAPTFERAIEEWFELYVQVEHSNSPQTQHIYRWAIDHHLTPEFGRKRLDEITRKMVAAFISRKLSGGLTTASVRNIIAPMRGMFNYVIADKSRHFQIAENPCVRQGQFKKQTSAKVASDKFTIPPPEAMQKFLELCAQKSQRLHALVAVGLFAGLRRGEMFALRWPAIDLDDKKELLVRRTLTRFKTEKTPKSHAVRNVPMADDLVLILKEWRTAQKAAWLKKGKPMPELVFPGEDGGYINEARFRTTKFYPVRIMAGLPSLRLHDLRHCYASYMLAQGTPLSDLKDLMGHYSIQITVDLYGHMVPRNQHAYANAMAKILLGKAKGKGA
jgi:integrase